MKFISALIIASVGGVVGSSTTILTQSILKRRKLRLSQYEKRILIMAAENQGEIKIYSSDQEGDFLMIGPSALNQGAVEKAAGLEALKKLVQKECVRFNGGTLFMLTHSGFKKAKKLGANLDLPK